MIETVKDFVNELGGVTKASIAFGVATPSVVGNWAASDRIPPKHHYRARELCKKHGIRVRTKFWEEMV
jgi:hypothetical protein